jgi:hypothetical protein
MSQVIDWKLILYIERKVSIGSANAARVAGRAEASNASNIIVRTAIK